jgi:hypothetical protein
MKDNYDLDGEYGAFWDHMDDEDYGFFSNLSLSNVFGGGGSARPEICQGSGDTASVKELQGLLGISADGIFGSGTATAVKNFQILHNLTATGCADSATWAKLGKTKTPEQQAASQQAAVTGIQAGAGLATSLLSAAFQGKKGKKGKKGKRGANIPPPPPLPEEGTNWLMWIGIPLVLVVVSGGIWTLTRPKEG